MQEGNLFLPWYNFPLIDFLKEYLKPQMQIFEFGCGFSTLFYSQQKCIVTAFETRMEWVQKINTLGIENNLSNNFHITHCVPNTLSQSIMQCTQNFDVIVIDSYHRLECLKTARTVYKGGIIILDNSERPNLLQAKDIMQGFEYKEFSGHGVAREGKSYSTVFWKSL